MTKSPAEFHGAEAKTVQVSHARLASQNFSQISGVPHEASLSLSTLVCPLNQPAGASCLFARPPHKSAAHASTTSPTGFAFNGPYLYSSMMSSQPNMHQTLEVDPVEVREKSVSLQYVTLPKEDCHQPPHRQGQPGEGPPQPLLLPDQKEIMLYLDDEKEVSPAAQAGGKGTDVRREEQKSPKALSCITSPQHCPLEYITTESLLLPPTSDSTHPPLVTAGELPCDSQKPQPPSDHACHEFCPGKTDVIVPVSGQATSSSELHQDTSENPLGLHGPS
ncbi:LOW QUALITY PROTEIN: uncharacterized protein FYW35_010340 [Pterocles gutturalis]